MSPETTSVTTDSFDPHIVPAETKARKQREGTDYKHTPDNAADSNSIHTADGYTVDTEGLVNNYAVEPPMYVEEVGDLKQESLAVVESFTIVDVFSNSNEAENVATEIHNKGLSREKISVLGQNYQNAEHGYGSLNWQDIETAGGLAKVLISMGIVKVDAQKYETDIAAGKFLVVVIGAEDDAVTAKEILLNTGHRISSHQEKV
jgi:hypothetical protein